MKNRIWLLLIGIVMVACFEDKGNYEYNDINQLTINNVDSIYYRDQFDSLYINPELSGSLYSEDDRFEYEWNINNYVVSREKELVYRIETPLGKNLCKYIVTDKALGTKVYYYFHLQVTSSTASDAIIILSNYKGKAELSFKRLDRNTPFMEVFYEKVNGEVLGIDACRIGQNYYPYDRLGGLLVHTQDALTALDVTTISPVGKIDGAYIYSKALPRPQLGAYQVNGFAIWSGRDVDFWGMRLIDSYSFIIADGKLTLFQYMDMMGVNFSCKVIESPYGGGFSPIVYPAFRSAGDGIGYDMAEEFNMFDETVGRFVRCDVIATRQAYVVDNLKEFPGYKLIYGTPVQEKNYSVAILNNDISTKLLYMKTPGMPGDTFEAEIVGEVDVATDILDAGCDFAMRTNTPNLFWIKGNKVYEYNVNNIFSPGIAPSISNVVVSLDKLNLGYDANAEITCMYLTRSQKSLVLGISRYGNDKEGGTDELKGDVVVLDANTYEVKDYYPNVSGYPVDVIVKYQENYQGGRDESGKMMDNI